MCQISCVSIKQINEHRFLIVSQLYPLMKTTTMQKLNHTCWCLDLNWKEFPVKMNEHFFLPVDQWLSSEHLKYPFTFKLIADKNMQKILCNPLDMHFSKDWMERDIRENLSMSQTGLPIKIISSSISTNNSHSRSKYKISAVFSFPLSLVYWRQGENCHM